MFQFRSAMLAQATAAMGGGSSDFVGGTTGKNTAGADFNTSLASLTGGSASAPAQNDVVVVAIAWSCAFSSSNSFTGGSDTSIVGNNSGAYVKTTGSVRWGNDTRDVVYGLYYQVMGATPDTSIACNWHNAATDACIVGVHVWRNRNTTTPQDAIGTIAEVTNTCRPNPPSVTPVTSGAIIVASGAGSQGLGGSALTIPSGMENGFVDYGEGSSRGLSLFMCSLPWSGSGAYDPAAATGGNDTTSDATVAQTIALKPA